MIRKLRTAALVAFFAAALAAIVVLAVLTLQAAAEKFPGDWDPPALP